MSFFAVQVLDSQQHILGEVDIPLTQFWGFFDKLEQQTRTLGLFQQDDAVAQCLVPESVPPSKKIHVEVQDKILLKLGQKKRSVYLPKDTSETQTPVEALSFWLYVKETKRKCAIRIPVTYLFCSSRDHLLQKLTKDKKPFDRQQIQFRVLFYGQDLYGPPQKSRQTMVFCVLPDQTLDLLNSNSILLTSLNDSSLQLSVSAGTKSVSNPAEVVIEGREVLERPTKKVGWGSFKSKLIGRRREDDLRIMIPRNTIKFLEGKLKETRNSKHEHVGILLGDVFNDENDQLFLHICGVATIEPMTISLFDQRFNKQWEGVLAQTKQAAPAQQIVAWYRTHEVDSITVGPSFSLLPDEQRARVEDESPRLAKLGKEELEFHRKFFHETWQVAAIIHVRQQKIAFHQLVNGDLREVEGFYVYE